MREFGTEGYQIRDNWFKNRCRRFDCNMGAIAFELAGKPFDLRRQKGLAAGDDDEMAWVFFDFIDNIGDAPRPSFWPPRSIGCVAPDAAKIAPGSPNEYRWHTAQAAFTLNRIENFADAHRTKLSKHQSSLKPPGITHHEDHSAAKPQPSEKMA